MADLRCNSCLYLRNGFCSKLNEALPHGLAKLFYGGAESIYAGTVTYPSECGIENEKHKEVTVDVLVPESVIEELPSTQ
jgi:hypothetical protein